MNTYYADINKITDDDIEVLKKGNKEDSVVFFYGKNTTIPIKLHEELSQISMEKRYFSAETDIEKSFFAGMMYGKNENGNNIFLSGISLPAAIKKIILPNTSSGKTKGGRKLGQKKKPASVSSENMDIAEKDVSIKEEKINDKLETKIEPVIVNCSLKKKETADKEVVKEQNNKARTSGTKKKESPWASEDSRNFFITTCGLPAEYQKDDVLIDNLAQILYEEENVNDALVRIDKEFGREIEKALENRINISVSSIKHSFEKKVDKIICL